jgi:hypothetical protein
MATDERDPTVNTRAARAERRNQLRETAQQSNAYRGPQNDPGESQVVQRTTGQTTEIMTENVVTSQGPSFPSILSSVLSDTPGRENIIDTNNNAATFPRQNSGRKARIRFGSIGEEDEDEVSAQTHDQMFLTAPAGSESPVEGPSSRPSKGKERAPSDPSQEYSSTWPDDAPESIHYDDNRDNSRNDEKWTLFNEMLAYWSSTADQLKGDYTTTENDLNGLRYRVLETNRRLDEMTSSIADIQVQAGRLMSNAPSPKPVKREEPSPREQARQAIFAEQGASEDPEEYMRRLRAQSRFRIVAQSSNRPGAEILIPPTRRSEGRAYLATIPSQPTRTEELESPEFISTPDRRENRERLVQMPGWPQVDLDRPRIAMAPPRHAWMRQRPQAPDKEPSSPSDSESSDSEENDAPPSVRGQQRQRIPRPSNDRRRQPEPQRAFDFAGNQSTGILDQDYARRANNMSSGTTAMPATWHESTLSMPESELEEKMNEGLRNYIRDSLFGMPDDLPEIKGMRAKLPEAYTGEDDFERFENWVQGLLRYFKLHRLTGQGRDGDRILVAGSCLKGRAETWFNHEVERPQRIIRDWTFEFVALGLQQAFITTATLLQAVQKYAQIRFSREHGIHAFYRDLLMWAGRLAQYPDAYSFKQRLMNGLPTEYRNHLVLYEGISAEHSSINDIVQKARRYEKILVTLRPGRTGEKDNKSISKTRLPDARVERSGQQLRPRTFRTQ